LGLEKLNNKHTSVVHACGVFATAIGLIKISNRLHPDCWWQVTNVYLFHRARFI